MITEKEMKQFISKQNYDLRETNNGRWIDQKCTPDVVSFIADCVIQFVNDTSTEDSFTKDDIWKYPYAEEFISAVFSKPSTKSKKMANEYDKFFAQPLEMFAAAGVLKKWKQGRNNYYSVLDYDILEYVSMNERNSINFLVSYCDKVVEDSGIKLLFTNFFTVQDRDSFLHMKDGFEDFTRQNTPIKGIDEPRRIFTKVINPLAFKNHKLGTKKGNLSKSIITYSELMYNRENFRDMYAEKPKGVSRKEWESDHPRDANLNWYKYESIRAKKYVRMFNQRFNNGKTEVFDDSDNAPATQIHHIFPEHAFHEIAMYHENLIALTPNQHMTKAHPNNDTKRIDKEYQKTLLLSKANTINSYKMNSGNENDDDSYSFDRLVEVLNIGLDKDYDNTDNDYSSVTKIINENF